MERGRLRRRGARCLRRGVADLPARLQQRRQARRELAVSADHRALYAAGRLSGAAARRGGSRRSEEHTSELQSLMRISYAVFCLKKKKEKDLTPITNYNHQ